MQPEKTPKLSVCVITYNQEKHIRQCLQSVVDQDVNFEYEIIVGEDCSSDGTRRIVREFQMQYPKLFKLILHDSNVGGCENYRSVHFAARGEYIAHMDGDDYWHPGKLQAQINFMERNQNCAAVYTNAWVENNFGGIIGVFSSGVKSIFELPYLIQKGNFITSSSTMYRTKFREVVIPASGEFVDFLLHIRLAQCGKLSFIDRNLVSYVHQSATSVILNDNIKVRQLIWDALQDVNLPKGEQRSIDKAKLAFIADTIIFELLNGQRQRISKWVSLLSSASKQSIRLLNLKLMYFVVIILGKKILNRFRRGFGKGNKNHVFYKK